MKSLIHDPKTFWIHFFLVGIPSALLMWFDYVAGASLWAGFGFYEWIEYDDIRDHAYRDIQGALTGFGITAIILFGIGG